MTTRAIGDDFIKIEFCDFKSKWKWKCLNERYSNHSLFLLLLQSNIHFWKAFISLSYWLASTSIPYRSMLIKNCAREQFHLPFDWCLSFHLRNLRPDGIVFLRLNGVASIIAMLLSFLFETLHIPAVDATSNDFHINNEMVISLARKSFSKIKIMISFCSFQVGNIFG